MTTKERLVQSPGSICFPTTHGRRAALGYAPHMQRAVLERVLEAHAEWLSSAAERGVRADLSGRRIESLELGGVDLRWALLRDTVWTNARLVHRVGFNELDLSRAFIAADLTGARLEGAQLEGSLEGTRAGELDAPRLSSRGRGDGGAVGRG